MLQRKAFGAILVIALSTLTAVFAQLPEKPSNWVVYITNDTCPDYTWGNTEEEALQDYADLVRAHLDQMCRTDALPAEDRDHYNMTALNEALAFVSRYPERKQELIRRIKEGRVFVSPYLNNSLWGFQSFEGALRTFYPARRLEREWDIPIDVAEHIELPSLPGDVASILAGSGIRWLSVPFYDFDSTFAGLQVPPLFILEGPDGGRVRVVMDSWASHQGSYAQGALLLRDSGLIERAWLPHYQKLGADYPLHFWLASGTHSDVHADSAGQTAGFAEAITAYNSRPGEHPLLMNASLRQFTDSVDRAEAQKPFLPVVRGSFGHAWESWPVSMAKYVADLREGERLYLEAEPLLVMVASRQPSLLPATLRQRERAEWCWAMLADHAWNGTDAVNQQVNADLRRSWSSEFKQRAQDLLAASWASLGLRPGAADISVFNPLSFPRSDLVRIEIPPGESVVEASGKDLPSQVLWEDGRRILYFLSPEVPAYGFGAVKLRPVVKSLAVPTKLEATSWNLASPYYRVTVDPASGGISNLIYKPSGAALLAAKNGPTMGQTVYFDGQEHRMTRVTSEVAALGPVLARLKISGIAGGLRVICFITVYADLDRLDFDYRITKPITTGEERLLHLFPIAGEGAVERIETTAAVLRPFPQPAGDLLPGADTRRIAAQGFVDVTNLDGTGMTIAPLDAFLVRQDLGTVVFEALGNDQDYKEVIKDQDKVQEFRFRYVLRGHKGPYNGPAIIAWSRAVATPLLAERGSLPESAYALPSVKVDSRLALATCLKPADDPHAGGTILRLRETAGKEGPVLISTRGFRRAIRTDLLERDQHELAIHNNRLELPVGARGFATVRLLP